MLLQCPVSAVFLQLAASVHLLHHIHHIIIIITVRVVRAEMRIETLTRLNPEGYGWHWKANQSLISPTTLLFTAG